MLQNGGKHVLSVLVKNAWSNNFEWIDTFKKKVFSEVFSCCIFIFVLTD